MSVLRILRNLAVLVILAVAVLTLTPGSAMAKHRKPPVCLPQGAFCLGRTTPCCAGLYCQRYFCVSSIPY